VFSQDGCPEIDQETFPELFIPSKKPFHRTMKKKNQHVDLRSIAWDTMIKYGFEPRFPEIVVREVKGIQAEDIVHKQKDVRDLRKLHWSSIDNFDSLDLDQLEYCERTAKGEIRVLVAIADVDAYVPKRSKTDQHAAHNGTSVYTGIETFPLLPDRLSKGISSLLPGHDHLAIVIEYSVLSDGSVRHENLYRALVANKAKLIYESIGEWLEGTAPVPLEVRNVPGLEDQLHLQAEASRLLKKHRTEQGALELSTIEAQPMVEGSSVKDLVIQRQNRARQLIEEFMVAANGGMVAFLENAGLPMIQRVVRVPRFWDEIVQTAALYHETLPAEPDAKALARFLNRQQVADPERFPDLSLTIVKLLGPGEYAMLEPGGKATGHFSLAVIDYTHATAPNRRYVDLVNQRLTKSVFDRKTAPYTPEELAEMSLWLTDREKASKKVKRFMRKAVAAVLLHDRYGEVFDALVTGVTDHGTFVRLISPPAEGKIVHGDEKLKVGQKIRVRLISTDPWHGHIDFAFGGTIKA
jgi:exoribonuclease-2